MHLSAALFLLSAVGLGAAVGHSSLQDRSPRPLAEPATQDSNGSSQVRVTLNPIQPMPHYYGSEEDSWAWYNPFIPPDNRAHEREALAQRGREPAQPEWQEAPPPPVEITPPSKPNIPAQALKRIERPVVVGALLRRHRASALVAYDDAFHIVYLGERIGPWTLDRINANEAWMVHGDDSRAQRFPIRSETAMVLDRLADTAAPAPVRDQQSGDGSGTQRRTPPRTPGRPQDRQGTQRGLPDGFDINDPQVQEALQGLPPNIRRMVEQNPEQAWRMWQNMQGE